MSDEQRPNLVLPPGKHGLQIGRKEGRVVLGVDGRPFAAFYPEQAITFVALVLKHIAGCMTESAMADRVVGDAVDESYGPPAEGETPPGNGAG